MKIKKIPVRVFVERIYCDTCGCECVTIESSGIHHKDRCLECHTVTTRKGGPIYPHLLHEEMPDRKADTGLDA